MNPFETGAAGPETVRPEPTEDSRVRRIVREELAGALAEFVDVAETGVYRSDDSIEMGAYSAIERAARDVADRLACPHERVSTWRGVTRCCVCGSRRIEEEEKETRA